MTVNYISVKLLLENEFSYILCVVEVIFRFSGIQKVVSLFSGGPKTCPADFYINNHTGTTHKTLI